MTYDDDQIVAVCDVDDREFGERLVVALAEFGIAVQLFDTAIPPEQYAESASYLLLLFSHNSIQNDVWQSVFMAFATRQKPLCIVRVDDVVLPDVLTASEWVDFSFGFQVGVNGVVYALQNPQVAASGSTTVIRADNAQHRVTRGTLIAFGIWVAGMILLSLIF